MCIFKLFWKLFSSSFFWCYQPHVYYFYHRCDKGHFIRLFYVVSNLIHIKIGKSSTDRQCRLWVCFSCLVCVVSNLLTRKVKKMESGAERIEKINKILFFYVHESYNNELRRRQIILRYLEIKIRRQRKILQVSATLLSQFFKLKQLVQRLNKKQKKKMLLWKAH